MHLRAAGAFFVGAGQGSVMGLAFSLAVLARPWSSGTGGTSLRGRVWVRSGRFMPFYAMASPQTSLLGMDCFLAVRF